MAKQFKVTDVFRKKKYLIGYETYQRFIEKYIGNTGSEDAEHRRSGKVKFGIPDDSVVFFVSEDDEDAEIDSDILATSYADKGLLIMKVEEISLKGVEVTDGAKYRASHSDIGNTGSEDAEHRRSDTAGLCPVQKADVEEWQIIEEGSEMKDHISKFGLKNIGTVMKKNLDKWKEKPLNIAVTGASGKGKSSFINSFRGLSPLDPGAAKVDVKECTKLPTPYRHPEIDSFVIWDVPGAGTETFPKATYLDQVGFDRYDFFIVFTSERFTEIDTWLVNEVKLRGKRCYIVRTKIDIDMENEKRTVRWTGPFNEKEAFFKLKKELHAELVTAMKGESGFHFFMISNYHTSKYDFSDLEFQLFKDVPSEKKTAMIFGIAGLSKDIVEEKVKVLRSRIWKIALLSGAGAAIPIPFISTGIDVTIILEEVLFYRSQFAVEDSSLEHLADVANVDLDTLKEHVHIQTPATLFSSAGIAQYLGKYIAAEAAEKLVQYTLPVIGTIISCGASYTYTWAVLEGILDMMKADAIKVLQFVAMKDGAAI